MVSGDSWCLRLVFSLQSSLLNENQFVNLFYQLVDVHCLQPKPLSQQVRYKQFQCSSHATEGNRFVLDAFSITFKKMHHPRPLFRLFSVFLSQTSNKIFTANYSGKCTSSIQCWDLNTQLFQNMSLLP